MDLEPRGEVDVVDGHLPNQRPENHEQIISISTIKLTIAMRWRQKRRHASRHSETTTHAACRDVRGS